LRPRTLRALKQGRTTDDPPITTNLQQRIIICWPGAIKDAVNIIIFQEIPANG